MKLFVLFLERRGPFEFSQHYNTATYDNQIDAPVHTTEDPFDFKIKVEEFDFSCLYSNNNNCELITQTTTDKSLVNDQKMVQDSKYNKEELSSFKNTITTPTYNKTMADSGCSNSTSAVTDFTDILFDTNCDQYLIVQSKSEDSNNSGSEAKRLFLPKLKLNITGKIIDNTSTLSTPEVIETITDIENENFNILDIVNEKVSSKLHKIYVFFTGKISGIYNSLY